MYTCESNADTPDALDGRPASRREERIPERLLFEASKWVARLDRCGPDGKTLAKFVRWLATSTRHEAAYLRLAAAWSRLDSLRALRSAEPDDGAAAIGK